MPIQSNGLLLISLFFLFSLSYIHTFIAFVWFSIVNEMKTRKYLPQILNVYMSKLKRKNKIIQKI
jgi:hypothetical protein